MSETAEENLVEDEEPDYQSWDDFWSEVVPQTRTEKIRGVEVNVPANLPLKFTQELQALMESERDEDVRYLLGQLFGTDVLDQWVEAGMTSLEFQVALTWGIAQGQGKDLTFRQAYEAIRDLGKSRAAPASPSRPAGSGGQSKRTSGGNTASRRRT